MITRPVPEARIICVKSPLVGVFRRMRDSGSRPFIQEGDRVQQKTVLCAIEDLSVTYHIRAFTRGLILDILPEDRERVEYGEMLFRIALE